MYEAQTENEHDNYKHDNYNNSNKISSLWNRHYNVNLYIIHETKPPKRYSFLPIFTTIILTSRHSNESDLNSSNEFIPLMCDVILHFCSSITIRNEVIWCNFHFRRFSMSAVRQIIRSTNENQHDTGIHCFHPIVYIRRAYTVMSYR